jgi:hypothetical protein
METIVKIIKAFHGDIFGTFVRETLSDSNIIHSNIPIDARIEESVFFYMMNVFAALFKVDILIVSPNQVTLTLTNDDNSVSHKIRLWKYKFTKWSEIPYDFDVDMLATNSNALFVRPNLFLSFNIHPNKIDLLKHRIRERHFSIVALPAFPSKNILRLMQQANQMIIDGWMMDDVYCKKSTWVTNRWSDFKSQPHTIRTSYTAHDVDSMLSQDQCSLCQDKFLPDSIVVNTCCNHNFHWKCSEEQNSICGLVTWFVVQEKFPCPYCRQSAVRIVL